jgi:putative DNA primase/helicase
MTEKKDPLPYIALGSKDGIYYFYNIPRGEVFKTDTFSVIHLLKLDRLKNWRFRFPEPEKSKSSHGFNAVAVAEYLISKSDQIGFYDPEKVRGIGVWQDAGSIIVNCGDFLLIDGQKICLAEFKSKFVYVKTLKEQPKTNLALNKNEAKLLLDIIGLFKFTRDCDRYFLLGWLMLAPIGGALPVRPHMWITGKKGLGKSTIVEFCSKLLGDISLACVGPCTEAGIRQAARHNAQPLIYDEVDAVDSKGTDRIGKIIDFLRSCWSDTDARTYKGTVSGVAFSYNAKLCAMLASINIYLPTEADRSRFTVIELKDHAANALDRIDDNRKLRENINLIDRNFSQRFYALAISRAKIVLLNYKIFFDVIAIDRSNREAQQLGMILAGYWAFYYDTEITIENATKLFTVINNSLEVNKDCEDIFSDEEECLNVLLSYRIYFVRDGNSERFEDLIGNMIYDIGSASTLLSYGIKVNHAKNTFSVAYHHSELSKIYRGSRWEKTGGWIAPLSRIEGAKKRQSSTFGSRNLIQRSIEIPFPPNNEAFGKEGQNISRLSVVKDPAVVPAVVPKKLEQPKS